MPRNQYSNHSKLPYHYESWLINICTIRVINYYELIGPSQKDIISKLRWSLYVEIRQQYPEISTTQIGKIFNRDHSSVTYGLKKMNQGKDNVS